FRNCETYIGSIYGNGRIRRPTEQVKPPAQEPRVRFSVGVSAAPVASAAGPRPVHDETAAIGERLLACEPLLRLLVINWAIGVAVAAMTLGGLLALNTGGLRTLV